MPEYNMVKYCRICKKRYIVGKGQSAKVYCVDCQKKIDEGQEK